MNVLFWWQATVAELGDGWALATALRVSDDPMANFIGSQLSPLYGMLMPARIWARVESLAAEERAQLAEEVEQASIRRLAEEGRHLHLVAA